MNSKLIRNEKKFVTVSINGVEHGHDPLLEGGGEVIVLFALANVLQ